MNQAPSAITTDSGSGNPNTTCTDKVTSMSVSRYYDIWSKACEKYYSSIKDANQKERIKNKNAVRNAWKIYLNNKALNM